MNWTKIFVGSILVLTMSSCSGELEQQIAEEEVKLALTEQQDAWNNGDLEGFMAWYTDADDLSFVTAKGVTYGNDNLLERYKKSYPDKASMGRLEFDILEYKSLGDDYAMVIGKWRLFREKDSPNGFFSLLWQRTPEGWRIINDHTS